MGEKITPYFHHRYPAHVTSAVHPAAPARSAAYSTAPAASAAACKSAPVLAPASHLDWEWELDQHWHSHEGIAGRADSDRRGGRGGGKDEGREEGAYLALHRHSRALARCKFREPCAPDRVYHMILHTTTISGIVL
eukprot:281878-Rhodomonas_salina.2